MTKKVKDFYLVSLMENNHYDVAKFDTSASPDGIYKVVMIPHDKAAWCSCPGFRSMQAKSLTDPKCGEHKHVRIVGEFIRLGNPQLTAFWFNPTTNAVEHNQFGFPLEEILNDF